MLLPRWGPLRLPHAYCSRASWGRRAAHTHTYAHKHPQRLLLQVRALRKRAAGLPNDYLVVFAGE